MGAYSDLSEATKEQIESAKRLSDIINSMVTFYDLDVLIHSWIAVRLADGGSSRTLYESRADAVRYEPNADKCCFLSLRFCFAGMQVREAYAFLKLQRDVASLNNPGFRLVDPEARNGGHDFMMPITNEDVRAELRSFRRRVRMTRKGR